MPAAQALAQGGPPVPGPPTHGRDMGGQLDAPPALVEEELAHNAVEHAADCAEDEGIFDMQPMECP